MCVNALKNDHSLNNLNCASPHAVKMFRTWRDTIFCHVFLLRYGGVFFILLPTEKQRETLSRFNLFFIGSVDVYSRVEALIISSCVRKELFLSCRDYEFASSSWPPVSVLIEESVKRHSCCYAPAAVLLVVRTRGWIISLLWNESSAAALIQRPEWSYFHWFNFPVRSRKSSRWPVKSLWNRTISCGKNTVDRATVTSPGGLWRTRMNVLLGGSALVC